MFMLHINILRPPWLQSNSLEHIRNVNLPTILPYQHLPLFLK